jgi:transposase
MQLLNEGKSIQQTSKETGISYGIVQKLRVNKSTRTDSACNGRPKALNTRMKQHIVSCITKDSMENAVKVHKHIVETFGVTSSIKTVRRALQEAGLVAFVKPKNHS